MRTYATHMVTTENLFDEGARLTDEYEVARLMGVSIASLRRWRSRREGPRFRKCGRRVLYQLRDVLAYIEALPSAGGAGKVA